MAVLSRTDKYYFASIQRKMFIRKVPGKVQKYFLLKMNYCILNIYFFLNSTPTFMTIEVVYLKYNKIIDNLKPFETFNTCRTNI